MIHTDQWILDFLKENMITISFLYAVVKMLFPDSKILKAIGDAFKARFGK
jgi:hypothetical protein